MLNAISSLSLSFLQKPIQVNNDLVIMCDIVFAPAQLEMKLP
jgi:hypothetical protein